MKDGSPITELEAGIIRKFCGARFPPGTASKRFARDLSSGYIRHLSPRGRRFLAYVAHRFRRQCNYTMQEWNWIQHWLKSQPEPAPAFPEPLN